MALISKEGLVKFAFGKDVTRSPLEIRRENILRSIRQLEPNKIRHLDLKTNKAEDRAYSLMLDDALRKSGMDTDSGGDFIAESRDAQNGTKTIVLHFENTIGKHWHFLEERIFNGENEEWISSRIIVLGGDVPAPHPKISPLFAKREPNNYTEETYNYY